MYHLLKWEFFWENLLFGGTEAEILHLIFAWETYIIITATPPFIGNLECVPRYICKF